ncbi:MAG: hypothetical protein MJK04_31490, partial [Psychrosphaera sp.]|nr:hypothetical protein [Psychrosphaera sp.]
MKPLLFASCLAIISLFAKPAIAIEGEHQLYADLLTRDNSTYFKVAAQSIYNKKIRNIELIDMLAEVFAKRIHGEIYFDPDTTAWLAKAIGTSGSKRYTSLLNIAKNSDISRKARKHVKTSLGKLTKASDSQFVKGSIDLAQKAKEISQQRKAQSSVITPETFAKVTTGDTIDQVLSKLGMPNSVEVAFATQRRPWVGVVSYSMLQLIYTQQGSINFHYAGRLTNWTVK